jgi:hypothetical protein
MEFIDNEYEPLSDNSSSTDSIIIDSDSDDSDSLFNYQLDDIADTLYNEDVDHIESDKYNDHYYLGLYKYVEQSGNLLFMMSASNKLFLKYPHEKIVDYLKEYSIVQSISDNVDIMKMYVKNDTYYVVLKTHWIRLIQRKWKSLFNDFKKRQEQKLKANSLKYREQNGNFPNKLNYRPKIYGMMRKLNQVKEDK